MTSLILSLDQKIVWAKSYFYEHKEKSLKTKTCFTYREYYIILNLRMYEH